MTIKRFIFISLCIVYILMGYQIVHPEYAISKTSKPVFSTWDIFEVDKCASIWLIKRFIDKNAEIRFFPKGEPIPEGIPFDTPDARFRRYHNAATFDILLRHYKINDERCVYIAKIIHDIEINIWEKKVMKESRYVSDAIAEIIESNSASDIIVDKSLELFDKLYRNVTTQDIKNVK